MTKLPLTDDFRSIVLNETPLIDLRAPVEFDKGAFPGAVNLPLMDDEERRLVGICYKHEGNAAAVKLGHKLVSGETKEARMAAWMAFMDAHPDAMLYCFRGGQRSQIVQEWLAQRGRVITRLKGGYKVFRNYLMTQTEASVAQFEPIILGGRTGSGKTLLIEKLSYAVDLEGLANHRGSSFGRHTTPQPTQIAFENALAYVMIQKLHQGMKHLVFEDEGKNIGRLYLPETFAAHLLSGPLVILETPMSERVEITFDEYVLQEQAAFEETFGKEEGIAQWREAMLGAMERIKRRLGGLRHQRLVEMFESASADQMHSGSPEAHKSWVAYLLREYYDPMYDYQIAKRQEQVIFRGGRSAVEAFLKERIS